MISVSVIVPVFNREKLIIRCLDSIFNQTVKPDEIIVIDNNSVDSTYSTVEKWIEHHKDSGIKMFLLKEEKKGACAARQKGLENASGTLVIFFDSDDEMNPGLIEKSKLIFDNNPALDIVSWKACIHLLDGSQKEPAFLSGNPLESHLIHGLFRPQGYMVKKEFLKKAGGWSKPVKVWNDYELGLRLLLNNPNIVMHPETFAIIYSQEESITGKDFSSKQGQWEATLREMDAVNDAADHPQKNKIRRILDYRRAILAAHYYKENNFEGARHLMDQTLNGKSFGEKLLLRFSYFYTRMGLRGAWRIVRIFY